MNDTRGINRATVSFIYLFSSSNIHFRLLAAEERDLTELEAAVVEIPVKLHIQFGAHTAQPDNQREGYNFGWSKSLVGKAE